ncbi:MAG: T9SS type A sorting domain-containing protein [Bacteroidia bacterium]
MKKIFIKIVLVFGCGVFVSDCYSQNPLVKQWDKRFGGTNEDNLTSLQQTSDGGYILSGFSLSGIGGNKTQALRGSFDYWIVKIDSIGNMEWDKDFGGIGIDYLHSLQQTGDEGYILAGYSTSDSSGDKTQPNWDTIQYTYDYWIVKLDSIGNKEWDKDFGGTAGDQLFSIQQTTDGGYILGGFSYSGISGDKTQAKWGGYDYWIIKIDSLGNKQWDKDFGGWGDDFLINVKQTSDGGYILGGDSNSDSSGNKTQNNWDITHQSSDFWIVKIDSLGNKQWDRVFGGTNDDLVNSLEVTADGGYILGGFSASDSSGNKTQATWGDYDYWIIKIDSLGNKQWDKDFGGSGAEELYNIFIVDDGGYLLSGDSYSPISGDKTENNLGQEQSWIVKTDSIGNKLWDKTLFTLGHDEIGLAIQTNDGCYAMANMTYAGIGGYKTQSSWASTDYWIIKFCDTTLTTSITNFQFSIFILQLFPNPATSTIQLTFNTKEKTKVQIEIINVMGERVFKSQIVNPKSQINLDVSFLAKGIYVVRAGDGVRWEHKKLVVE